MPKTPTTTDAATADRFRACVRQHLAALAGDLGDFWQTTQGRIFLLVPHIDDVADVLTDAYLEPTAHTISNLSQTLDAFLKAGGPAA